MTCDQCGKNHLINGYNWVLTREASSKHYVGVLRVSVQDGVPVRGYLKEKKVSDSTKQITGR